MVPRAGERPEDGPDGGSRRTTCPARSSRQTPSLMAAKVACTAAPPPGLGLGPVQAQQGEGGRPVCEGSIGLVRKASAPSSRARVLSL